MIEYSMLNCSVLYTIKVDKDNKDKIRYNISDITPVLHTLDFQKKNIPKIIKKLIR